MGATWAVHGQEYFIEEMCQLILDYNKVLRQRITVYCEVAAEADFSDRVFSLLREHVLLIFFYALTDNQFVLAGKPCSLVHISMLL